MEWRRAVLNYRWTFWLRTPCSRNFDARTWILWKRYSKWPVWKRRSAGFLLQARYSAHCDMSVTNVHMLILLIGDASSQIAVTIFRIAHSISFGRMTSPDLSKGIEAGCLVWVIVPGSMLCLTAQFI